MADPRVVIVGNSGAGKSTLAREHVREHGVAHLDLDTLAWRDTDPPERTAIADVAGQLRVFRSANAGWVAEGCYADLAALLVPHATELVFLDVPVARCLEHARRRPWEPHKYPSKQAQDANLDMLLAFISDYPTRDGPLGRRAHEALFAAFPGRKRRLVQPPTIQG